MLGLAVVCGARQHLAVNSAVRCALGPEPLSATNAREQAEMAVVARPWLYIVCVCLCIVVRAHTSRQAKAAAPILIF